MSWNGTKKPWGPIPTVSQSGWRDLNPRPLDPHKGAHQLVLPGRDRQIPSSCDIGEGLGETALVLSDADSTLAEAINTAQSEFDAQMDDDFNTAGALAAIFALC